MLQMVKLGRILDHFRSKAVQMLQMVKLGRILDHFGFGRCWHWPSPSVTPLARATCLQGPQPSMMKKLKKWGLLGPTSTMHGWPLPVNVQRDLCTAKALSQAYRQPSVRLRFSGAPISSHYLQTANFNNLVNLVLKRVRCGLNHEFCYI